MQSKTSKRRKQNGKRKGGRMNLLADSNEWATLTPKTLWAQLKSELKSYYDWELTTDNVDATVEMFSLQKISMLR